MDEIIVKRSKRNNQVLVGIQDGKIDANSLLMRLRQQIYYYEVFVKKAKLIKEFEEKKEFHEGCVHSLKNLMRQIAGEDWKPDKKIKWVEV